MYKYLAALMIMSTPVASVYGYYTGNQSYDNFCRQWDSMNEQIYRDEMLRIQRQQCRPIYVQPVCPYPYNIPGM